ncbi:MAG: hypothetical protein NTV98_03735 [Candidatus Roizmanbacteria bacterium]|nr:hypothetical protein [Candidatus Roizmanbacteria bacterium]
MNPQLTDLIQKTYVVLKDCMLYGLESGELTVEDSENSAYLIDRNMKQIDSRGELLLFTEELAKKYPSFQKGHILVRQDSVTDRDKQKLEQLQEKLRSFTNSSITNGS